MTPKQVKVMAAYFEATEQLADATDELILAELARRDGLICTTARYEKKAIGALAEYRAARAAMEAL